jgi:hypothetical protein
MQNNRVSISNLRFTLPPQSSEMTPSWPHACQIARSQTFSEIESLRKAVDDVTYAEANWDGYGALPISGETKRNAIAALNVLAGTIPAPTVVPNPNGTLSFEWETESGVGNLEIGKTRYSFYVKTKAGRAILSDGEANKVMGFLTDVVEGVLSPKAAEPAFLNVKFFAADV